MSSVTARFSEREVNAEQSSKKRRRHEDVLKRMGKQPLTRTNGGGHQQASWTRTAVVPKVSF